PHASSGDIRMSLFSAGDEQRISAAITDAERRTSGEIVVVVAAQSDGYHYVPPLVGAIVALFVPWPLIFFTQLGLVPIYLIQLAVFAAVTAALMPVPIRTTLVPMAIKRLHAHRRAIEQFLVQNLHTTTGRTGVLLFISVAEHHAEIVADKAIDARVPAGTWKRIIDDLTDAIGKGKAPDGFVAAIAAIGAVLAQHFPPGTQDTSELPDHLIILP
ncbi:TPM domain-containing protein, partial [Hyphomicrobium sp.]